LLAESKTAREALDKVPVLLRRFRQSVLAKAFKGELTQRDPNDEPAQKLLERIRQERNKGKQKTFIENQEQPSPIDLPELPETWTWTTLDEIVEIKMGQSPDGSSYNQDGRGIPLLNGPTEFGKEHPTPVQWTTKPTKICNKGDLLICVRGNTTGRMNWADQPYCIGRGLAAISTNPDMVEIRLLFYYLSKETEEIMRRTTGSTFPNLQSNQLRKLPFPLAPYQEQKRLVLKIDECFSLADNIETSTKKAKERAEKIDQAILAKAFRGELVPQDPNDEPASVLLQRIKSKTKQQTTIQTELTN
jgi:type I restriction enzyme S subunit